jgi:hypothetical protein
MFFTYKEMKSIFTALFFFCYSCFLIAQTTPNLAWAKRLGNNSLIGVYPSAITTDNFGNSFIAGIFTTNGANIGGAVLSSPNNAPSDGYIIKYNAQGQVAWSMTTHNIQIGHTGDTFGPNTIDLDCNRMTTDNEGNLYVTGRCKKLVGYRSRISNYYFPLDSALVYPYANRYFPFVAKIGSTGNVLWVKTFTDDNVYVANAQIFNSASNTISYQNEIFIDTYNNLNLTGVFYNRIGFDSTHVLFTDTSYNPADIDTIRTVDNMYDSIRIMMRQQAGMYKATFNPQGDVVSAVKLSSAADEYLANQQTIFYHVPPPSVPNVSPILLFQQIRETKIENARADAGNNLYRLRHRKISNNLDTNPVLYSYTPSGALLGTDTLAISASTAFQINDFKVTPNGDIVLTGIWKGNLTINGVSYPHYSAASYDGFVCVLNKDSHTTQSLYTRKTATDDYLVRAEVDELGNIYVCGHFTASFVGYIAKINPAGTLLWEQQINKISNANIAGTRWTKHLSQNQNGNVWVSGAYYHSVYFSNAYQFTTPINTNETSFNGFLAQYGQCNTAKPVLNAPAYAQLCEGDSMLLSADFSNTAYKYFWSTGDTLSSIYVTQPGKYYYIAQEQQDSLGCYGKSNEVWVSKRPLPEVQITASDTIVCAGTTITLSASGAETYTWSNDISNEVAFVPDSTATYTVTATDSTGCSNTAMQLVAVNPLPDIQVSASDSIVCAGTAITLSASGAETYAWSNGITSDVAFVPDDTNTYTVIGTDTSGCSNTALQSIIVNALPEIQIIASDSIVCAGTAITLSASGADTYTWSNGIDNDVAFVPDNTNTYTVTGTDTSGCSNTALQSIIVNALPEIQITASDTIVCAGTTIILSASGAESYTWSNGISNDVAFVPDNTTTYTVTGTDTTGCENTATQHITVNALPPVPVITAIGVELVSSAAEGNQWYFEGEPILGATQQTHTPTQDGSYYVVVTDTNHCTAQSDPFVFSTIGISPLSTGEGAGVRLYPNPNRGTFTIDIGNFNQSAVVQILDMQGRLLHEQKLNKGATEIRQDLPVSNYMLKITVDGKTSVQQLQIQH